MGIISIMLVTAGSMLGGAGDQVAQNAGRALGIFSLASQTAKASNRPVYVFVADETNQTPPGLRFALVADSDGMDPFSGGTLELTITSGANGPILLGAAQRLNHVKISDIHNDLSDTRTLNHPTATYSYSIKFLPTGQVVAEQGQFSPEFTIGFAPPNAQEEAQTILVKLAGLTGMGQITQMEPNP